VFCRNCAAPVDPNAAICVKCGVLRTAGRGFCANCGKPHDPAADFCTGCGASLAAPAAIATSPLNTAFSFTSQAPGNAIPEEVARRWNWGGFLLSIFWPWWNANVTLKWITVAAILLSSFTAGLSGLALAIYFGISGNRIAARDRSFASTDEFIAVQRAWAKAGVIVLIVCGVCIPLFFIVAFFWALMVGIMAGHHSTYP
jgi:hypothetical protein